MGKLTNEVFNESCCDGGECNIGYESARSCGCDPGANWTCQACKNKAKEAAVAKVYVNPLDRHLEEVVNVSWNYAKRCQTWQDHVMNAVLGLGGEAGEIVDLHKKIFYHSEKDRTEELINEIGDLCFYLAKLLELHGITLEECLEANKVKLTERHHKMFEGK